MAELEERQPAHVPQAEAGSLYDGIAKNYDLWARLTESKARKLALRRAAVEEGQATLEVAVGTGIAFLELVRRNRTGRNVGIDISPGMMAKARTRLEESGETNYELLEASAFAIPAPAPSFDLVMNSYMFDLIPHDDWDTIVAEFRRVLKSDGRLVLTNMTFAESRFSGVFDWVYRKHPRLLGGCRAVRLSPALERGGFDVVYRRYVQQTLFPSEVIVARPKGSTAV